MLQLPRDATAVRPGGNAGQCRMVPRRPRMLQARELNFRPESGPDGAVRIRTVPGGGLMVESGKETELITNEG
jgi:hypothetical protein